MVANAKKPAGKKTAKPAGKATAKKPAKATPVKTTSPDTKVAPRTRTAKKPDVVKTKQSVTEKAIDGLKTLIADIDKKYQGITKELSKEIDDKVTQDDVNDITDNDTDLVKRNDIENFIERGDDDIVDKDDFEALEEKVDSMQPPSNLPIWIGAVLCIIGIVLIFRESPYLLSWLDIG